MAGGRGNPGGIPLGQRTRVDPARTVEQHGTASYGTPSHLRTTAERRPYGETATYRDLPDGGCHVLVNVGNDPQPGLLIGWRKPDQLPWEGRCWFPQVVEGRWVLTDRWILAGAIAPA